MKKVALGVQAATVAALLVSVAACGGGGGGGGSSSGGTVLAAGPFSPTTLDPDPKGIVDEQTNFMLASDYMGRLVGIKPDPHNPGRLLTASDVQPVLASSYQVTEDGKQYQFTLRSGIKSNYGNPLTSQDVQWTFQRMVNTGAIGAILMGLANFDTKNPITVKDDQHFTLNLTAPSPIGLQVLNLGTMGILDQKAVQKNAGSSDPWGYTWLKSHVASFGPYNVSSFAPSVQTTLTARKDYPLGTPSVQKVIFKQVPSSQSRLQLLQGKEINFDWQASPSEYKQLKGGKNTIYVADAPLISRLVFNTKVAPVNNPAVRQAFQQAIDRTAIAKAIFEKGSPATSCVPTPIALPNFPKSNATADPAKSKDLLASAGQSGGLTLTVGTNLGSTGDLNLVEQFLQTQLGAAGIQLKFNNYPTQAAYLTAASSGANQVLLDVQSPFVPDPGFFMKAFLETKGLLNYGGYSNPSLDRLIEQSMSTTGDARKPILDQACGMIMNDVPEIPIMNLPVMTVTSPGLTGVYNYPDLQLHFDDMKVSG